MGGAANYVHNLIAAFNSESLRGEVATNLVLAVPDSLASQLQPTADIEIVSVGPGLRSRARFEQVTLRRLIRERRVDVLFASANLGMLKCPVPQLLLIRNAIFFSPLYEERFLHELPVMARAGLVARRRLVSLSAKLADRVMTPSQAMLDLVTARIPSISTTGFVNHYGVDATRFRERPSRVSYSEGARLLFTGLYSAHKNLGTLLEAIRLLSSRGTTCHLTTTADPNWTANPYTSSRRQDIQAAFQLSSRRQLAITGMLTRPQIDDLYRNADVFVYPSTVESFGHPLVEALASGLPVVAADVPINREVCGKAALYFSPFSPNDCARAVKQVIDSRVVRSRLALAGKTRIREFSNDDHFRRLAHALQSLGEC